jgi:transcriptional regulator with XRE-family HTH domain
MVRTRKAKGLSQADLAERLGVSQSWVSKLENPDIAHTFESILEYLQAVGADLDMEIRAGSEQFTVARAEPAKTAAAPAKDLGSTFLETNWEGPTEGVSKTLVWVISPKSASRDVATAPPKARRQLRYPDLASVEVVVSDATTAGYGGPHDLAN